MSNIKIQLDEIKTLVTDVLLKQGCDCLLYTSDTADEGLGVDLGGRLIIKK